MSMPTGSLARGSTELLGEAVHRHRAWSMDGMLERTFTLAFRDLVYAQIWEDPRVDMAAMEIEQATRIVTIASGGCNVLSYLTARPERIFAVDLNAAHIALNRLKIAAAKHLDRSSGFYAMFGAGDRADNGARYRNDLAPHLDAETRAYWEGRNAVGRQRISCFERGLYRHGLLGHFIALAHAVARLHGRDARRMMRARTRAEQIAIFEQELAPLFERPVVRWLLGHRAALYGLGIAPAQYKALIGDAPHMASVVRQRLRKLACDFDFADNYFAWQAFSRGYAKDGKGPHPTYLEPGHFMTLKRHADRVSVELTSFTAFLARQPAASLDRYVLLDAQDWMGDQELSHLWTEMTRTARPGARVIFRTAGEKTILPGRVPDALLARWTYASERSAALTREDRSAIYGGFHLYHFNAA